MSKIVRECNEKFAKSKEDHATAKVNNAIRIEFNKHCEQCDQIAEWCFPIVRHAAMKLILNAQTISIANFHDFVIFPNS